MSNLRNLEQRAICESKQYYDTEFESTIAAARSEHDFASPMEPYKCPFGHHWHIRNTLKGNRRKHRYRYWVCPECLTKLKSSNKLKHKLKHTAGKIA